MDVQNGCIVVLVYNPMPEFVEKDLGIFEKFHNIGQTDPLQDLSSFVSYFFQTFSMWFIAVTRVISSLGYGLNEAASSEEPKKVFIEWSKSSLYYAWISFCLPFIFLGGYVIEDCRRSFLEVEGPITEETARRKNFRLEEELAQSKIGQERAKGENQVLGDQLVAERLNFQQWSQRFQSSDVGQTAIALNEVHLEQARTAVRTEMQGQVDTITLERDALQQRVESLGEELEKSRGDLAELQEVVRGLTEANAELTEEKTQLRASTQP